MKQDFSFSFKKIIGNISVQKNTRGQKPGAGCLIASGPPKPGQPVSGRKGSVDVFLFGNVERISRFSRSPNFGIKRFSG